MTHNSTVSSFRRLVCLKMWFSDPQTASWLLISPIHIVSSLDVLSSLSPPPPHKKKTHKHAHRRHKIGHFCFVYYRIQLILLSLYLSATCNLLVPICERSLYCCKYWYIMPFSVNSAPTILNCWYNSNGIFLYICVRFVLVFARPAPPSFLARCS